MPRPGGKTHSPSGSFTGAGSKPASRAIRSALLFSVFMTCFGSIMLSDRETGLVPGEQPERECSALSGIYLK